MTAYRVRLGRLIAGQEDEESVEAEVGALLEAEQAADIHDLREMVNAYLEAVSKQSKG